MGCFTQAFVEIAKNLKYEDVFEEMDEETVADVKKEVPSGHSFKIKTVFSRIG